MPEAPGTLAKPWLPSSAARPLHWWGAGGLRRLEHALSSVYRQWTAAWGIDCPAVQLLCHPAGPQSVAADRPWVALAADARPQAWLSLPGHDDGQLLKALFRDDSSTGMLAPAVAAGCRQDAIKRVASLFELACATEDGSPPSALLARAGSGAVEVLVTTAPGLRLLLAPEVAARWCRGTGPRAPDRRERLAAATSALAALPVRLHVGLEGCELELAALQELQVGDVVRLDHALASPVAVRHGKEHLCHAYLGRRGNRKAVELAGRLQPVAPEVLP
jgi:flagellar motor switch/type III secretory pathway protein FliN